jgi:DNA-binding response OmpR family regulator
MTAVPSAHSQGSQPGKSRHTGLILLVEDDPKLRRLYTDVLSATGYTVLTASSGKEGLNLLMMNHVPKVVILDIMLPDINGIEICRRARQALGDRIPIIFLSSLDQIDVVESCIEAGGDDFIVKGSNLQAMTARIQHWAKTGASALNRANRERVLNTIQSVTQQAATVQLDAQKVLSSETDRTVAAMFNLVTKARSAAPEFGKTFDEKVFLVGYVIGIVRFTATGIGQVKARPNDYVRAVLSETGLMSAGEIDRLLPGIDKLMTDPTFAVAVNRGSADAVVAQAKGAGFVPASLAGYKATPEQAAHARQFLEAPAK